jgi:hypothetical protein
VFTVGGVIVAWFRRDAEVTAEESGSDLSHQFLAGIASVTKLDAPEIAVEAGRVSLAAQARLWERGS